ncbi:hypothetical protein [Streptomyces flavofungini]|uniref:Uncharacterized protein n=1 Tax=Streptomyces flavofungini TaxID=68200 RepID=A0ABS0XDR3_9ACTN|nr:hypothetical protein [Streptomyces flavofungini]MBJ3811360.1 hypothetical protein [Streptomyces flavofungini]GHC42837.1 hypothetical protein GCM10010349_03900 [Streptomyces flavofungini]
MTVAHEETDDAVDALTLAVTDAPVPGGLRADERFLAEHAAAVADVALLREQLRIVGDTLARRTEGETRAGAEGVPRAGAEGRARTAPLPPLPSLAPLPPPALPPTAPFRQPGAARRRAVLALAAALGAGLLGGVVWLGASGATGDGDRAGDDGAKVSVPGGGDAREHASRAPDAPDASKPPNASKDDEDGSDGSDGASDDRSPEAYVACARLVVEGTVHRVESLPGGTRDRITLDVSRYYKPAEGESRITFVMNTDVDPRLRAGDRALIGITKGESTPDLWTTGKRLAADRKWIEKALPGSRGMTC